MKYFAYGSNMSCGRLRARVPGARFIGVFLLTGHDLRFHKIGRDGSAKCDAFHTGLSGDVVEGLVFDLHSKHVPALDRAEGLGNGYEKRSVEIVDSAGSRLEAFTYVATSIDASLLPFCWYREHVIFGAEAAPLSPGYIERIKAVRFIADANRARAQEESGIYT